MMTDREVKGGAFPSASATGVLDLVTGAMSPQQFKDFYVLRQRS